MDTEQPAPGVPVCLAPGLRRILAPNPSPMTYWGTNTYLLGTRDLAVIDPGPRSAPHLDAILSAVRPGQSISHILVTHSHLDHSPLATALAHHTGAQVHAFGPSCAGRSEIMTRLAATGLADAGEGVQPDFEPDVCLDDGARITGHDWSLTAHWTPGHLGNHMIFQWDKTVFCGDLVMGWATSVIAPPDGDLTDFLTSCQRLRALDASVLHAGHGAPIEDPGSRITWLISHRQARESAILTVLQEGPATAQALARRIYTETPPALLPAAERNVLAHLIDLYGKSKVAPIDALTAAARFECL
ncbi:MAG: MBL fold metallo-hydrolase [Pseudomonadota bacterium]